jgi:hypothetical protein
VVGLPSNTPLSVFLINVLRRGSSRGVTEGALDWRGASVLPNPPHLMPREGIHASTHPLEAVESLVKAGRKPPHLALGGGRGDIFPSITTAPIHLPTFSRQLSTPCPGPRKGRNGVHDGPPRRPVSGRDGCAGIAPHRLHLPPKIWCPEGERHWPWWEPAGSAKPMVPRLSSNSCIARDRLSQRAAGRLTLPCAPLSSPAVMDLGLHLVQGQGANLGLVIASRSLACRSALSDLQPCGNGRW